MEDTNTFEKTFGRLEQILEKMNSQTIPLEDSLKLFEEADQLIVRCSKRLCDSEQKIETLIKSREQELVLTEEQKPATQPFQYAQDKGDVPF